MAISHTSGIGRTTKSSVGIDRLRIDFDSSLRRWFGRNIGLWHSKRQYFFDEEKAINLEMYINVSKLNQGDSEFESYRFNWWCEDEKDFFIKRPTYKSKGEIIDTPPRSDLWCAQTPQGFPVEQLKHAHRQAIFNGWSVTDDASLFERLGIPVKIYDAGPSNIKVTTPFDLVIAESILSSKQY